VPTAVADLKGIARLGRALLTGALPLHGLRARFGREPLVDGVPANMPRQLVRFASVGALSTLAYLVSAAAHNRTPHRTFRSRSAGSSR